MNEEKMRELVKECGLDWQAGYMSLFDPESSNRYALLIEAAIAEDRERVEACPSGKCSDPARECFGSGCLGETAEPLERWRMNDFVEEGLISGEWISWVGGNCPVAPDAMVLVRLRYGKVLKSHPSRWLSWTHRNDDGDIVAYQGVAP